MARANEFLATFQWDAGATDAFANGVGTDAPVMFAGSGMQSGDFGEGSQSLTFGPGTDIKVLTLDDGGPLAPTICPGPAPTPDEMVDLVAWHFPAMPDDGGLPPLADGPGTVMPDPVWPIDEIPAGGLQDLLFMPGGDALVGPVTQPWPFPIIDENMVDLATLLWPVPA